VAINIHTSILLYKDEPDLIRHLIEYFLTITLNRGYENTYFYIIKLKLTKMYS